MSKISTIVFNNAATVASLEEWIATFSSAEPLINRAFDIGEGVLAEVEIPDPEDDDVETMAAAYGFEWTTRLVITGNPTDSVPAFTRLAEFAFSFLDRFPGDTWLHWDDYGPILCRLDGTIALDEALFTKMSCEQFVSRAGKSWDDVAIARNRF